MTTSSAATKETRSWTVFVEDVASATSLPPHKVKGAVELLSEGASIPFIARYRKERTGSLDEVALRAIEDRLGYFQELADRKTTILKSIEEQGKLDDALRRRILETKDRKALEDLYLPFKPRRRTRATLARERGLEPLARLMLEQATGGEAPLDAARSFVDVSREVPDAEAALRGASDIVAEEWAERPEVRQWLREELCRGVLVSRARKEWKGKPSKFEMYYEFREPLARLPSHRYLAIRRGEAEGVLTVGIEVERESLVTRLKGRVLRNPRATFRRELEAAAEDAYDRLLFPSIETEAILEAKTSADEEAIAVFAQNLRDLLLAPPAGRRVVLGIDPGFRTGCKVVVIDATGRFVEFVTIYPTPPRGEKERAARTLLELLEKHDVEIIAIGNGTASRETDAFVAEVLATARLSLTKAIVNESGASIYSASELAAEEFPELDVTVRGAISIARRLQDPLAELVKIDPKSIGVGQYQHDVNPTKLRAALDREVESSVNLVGVEMNTASARLLSYVCGIGPRLAESIVKHRDQHGAFRSRKELLQVPRLGARAFEQSAGFLRIRDGVEPLDASAVHPESYGVVARMAAASGLDPKALIGNGEALRRLDPRQFVDDKVGLPTVQDIITELEKPGRDPRSEFKAVRFREEVKEIADLKPGMVLEGVVTNVTHFGAFLDIGVHQDGLIHISEIARKFVKDPREILSVGDVVKVKVLSVDPEKKRVSLSRKQVEGNA